MRERDWLAETREKKADVRELAGEQGRDGIRTQPSLEPGELERGVALTVAGSQEEELGLEKDCECSFKVSAVGSQTAMCRHLAGSWDSGAGWERGHTWKPCGFGSYLGGNECCCYGSWVRNR